MLSRNLAVIILPRVPQFNSFLLRIAICEHVQQLVFYRPSDFKLATACQEKMSCAIQDLNNRIIPTGVLLSAPSAKFQSTKTAGKLVVLLLLSSDHTLKNVLLMREASVHCLQIIIILLT